MLHHVRLAGGEQLALEFTPPMNPKDSKSPKKLGGTTALYVHGLGSNRGGEKALFFEQEFCARGFGFARFDFRGHGDSEGRMADLTMSRQLEDLAAILAWLETNAASQRLLLIGASLGALTVAWQGAIAPRENASAPDLGKLPIVGQVLLAPAFRIVDRYLAALGDFGRARWQREGIYRFVGPWFEFDLKWDVVRENERYSHERLLHDTWRPTLILHGSKDESAPVAESVAFAQRCAETRPRLVVLEGGDHRLTAFKERLVAETLDFVAMVGAGANACAR